MYKLNLNPRSAAELIQTQVSNAGLEFLSRTGWFFSVATSIYPLKLAVELKVRFKHIPALRISGVSHQRWSQVALIFLNIERGLSIVILTRFFQHCPDLLLSDILIDGGGCGRFVSQHFLNGLQMLALVVQ